MKKAIAIILCAVIFFSLAAPAFAADDEMIEKANKLYAMGLFNGVGKNEDGTPNFNLDGELTRAQAITMLVRLLGKVGEAKAGTWDMPFTDVPNWAKPYVGYAYANGLTKGLSATTFGSDDTVTTAQYITFALRALGYDSDFDFSWKEPWLFSYKNNITGPKYNSQLKTFTRGDAVIVSWSVLNTKVTFLDMSLYDYLVMEGCIKQIEQPLF